MISLYPTASYKIVGHTFTSNGFGWPSDILAYVWWPDWQPSELMSDSRPSEISDFNTRTRQRRFISIRVLPRRPTVVAAALPAAAGLPAAVNRPHPAPPCPPPSLYQRRRPPPPPRHLPRRRRPRLIPAPAHVGDHPAAEPLSEYF